MGGTEVGEGGGAPGPCWVWGKIWRGFSLHWVLHSFCLPSLSVHVGSPDSVSTSFSLIIFLCVSVRPPHPRRLYFSFPLELSLTASVSLYLCLCV